MNEVFDEPPVKNLPEGETLYINEWEAGLTFLIGAFVVLVGLVALLGHHGPYHQSPAWVRPALGVLCIALGVHVAAHSRWGLVVAPDGIAVQGAYRRRSFKWAEVERFEITNAIVVPSLMIRLLMGQRIRVPGFKTRSASQRKVAEERVAELNRRARANEQCASD